jgi:hypothetical protein
MKNKYSDTDKYKEVDMRFENLSWDNNYQRKIVQHTFLHQELDRAGEEIKKSQFGWLSPNKFDSKYGSLVRRFLNTYWGKGKATKRKLTVCPHQLYGVCSFCSKYMNPKLPLTRNK